MTYTRRLIQVTAGILTSVMIASAPVQVLADTAAVLPENISRFYWDLYHYQPTTQRYNQDGDREALAFPFTNATITGQIFPVPGLGATDILGDVAVTYQYDIDVLDAGYSYGVTDRLTVGFHIPYYWITNNVKFEVDSSSADVGLDSSGNCCIPVSAGGVPVNNEDAQNLIVTEFGINRIETWDNEGIGDIEGITGRT